MASCPARYINMTVADSSTVLSESRFWGTIGGGGGRGGRT